MPDTSRFYNAPEGPSVQPDEELPRRARFDVNASPAAFGGLVAQGEEKFGAGAQEAGQFFGQVAADQATNNFVQEATQIRGDFSNLRGQEAMTAWPEVQQKLNDAFEKNRADLPLGGQEYYDRFGRRELVNNQDYLLTHYNQQTTEWGKTVNDTTVQAGLTAIGQNPTDDNIYATNQARAVGAAIENAQLINGIDHRSLSRPRPRRSSATPSRT